MSAERKPVARSRTRATPKEAPRRRHFRATMLAVVGIAGGAAAYYAEHYMPEISLRAGPTEIFNSKKVIEWIERRHVDSTTVLSKAKPKDRPVGVPKK